MNDLPGKFVGIALAFILTVIMPFVNVVVEDEMIDRRLIIDDVRSFIDQVIDSRTITDAMIDELNVSLAAYGITVNYDIEYYVLSVNPDPLTTDSYYATYVLCDLKELPNKNGVKQLSKGDKITVHVYSTGSSTSVSLAHKLSGIVVKNLDERITARVR